jgi:hypothetical protein
MPSSAASLFGSTAVTMTPWVPGGRLAARASSGVSCASDRPSARCGANGDLQRLAAAAPNDIDRHAPPDGRVGNEVGHGLVRRHRLAVDAHNDIALLQAATGAGATGNDRTHDLAIVLRQAERWREILVERLEADTEVAALRPLTAHQGVDDGLGEFRWNRQADADRSAGR